MMSRSDPLNKSAISEQLFRVVRITPLPESQFGGAQFRFPGFRVAPGDAAGGQRELGREEHSNDRRALPEFELVMAAFHAWFHSCRKRTAQYRPDDGSFAGGEHHSEAASSEAIRH
jgi:hypothetical protein